MIIHDAESTYHSKKYLSNSYMSLLLQCPALYRYKTSTITPVPEPESPDLLLGRLFHALSLEPDDVHNRYMLHDFDGRTADGKAKLKECKENNIQLISLDMWLAAIAMKESLYANAFWSEYFTHANSLSTELSVYWKEGDIECKARIDALIEIDGRFYIGDLKSTRDASPAGIKKSIASYGYHRQCAWYKHALAQEGMICDGFYFFFVQKTPPYFCTVATVSATAEETALAEIRTAIDVYKQCTDSDTWPDYNDASGAIVIDLPRWYGGK